GQAWVAELLRDFMQRNEQLASTAFLGMGTVKFIGQEMGKGGQKKSAKLALERIQAAEILSFEQVEKKLLRHVFSIFLTPSPPAGERKDRLPIRFAQLFQSGGALGGRLLPGE